MVFSDGLIQTSEETLVERVQETKKMTSDSDSDYIKFTVQNGDLLKDGGVFPGIPETVFGSLLGEPRGGTIFRTKMFTTMGKVKKSYSERVRVLVTSLRFIFNGRMVNDDETPESLKMNWDDKIEVYLENMYLKEDGGMRKGRSIKDIWNTRIPFL